MAQENQEVKSVGREEELTEENFLKDLYTFMKQRDTPIERIPHLGFKQIDLYVMYKTVKELGGYHQVTAQQLWKKVYNILGGNPRSTSAATCTRRHYEKLLLPYECHLAGHGEDMVITPPRQHKRPRYMSYPDDECPRSVKRPDYGPFPPFKLGSHDFPTGMRFIPVPYLPERQHSLPTYFPGPPPMHTHLGLQTQTNNHIPAAFLPNHTTEQGGLEQPIKQLRELAKVYMSHSEPIDLSKKGGSLETVSHPPSSFAPPTSTKSPKFLNKASPLYPPSGATKDAGMETSGTELRSTASLSPNQALVSPMQSSEPHVIDLTSTSCASPTIKGELASPTSLSTRRVNHPTDVLLKHRERTSHPVWTGEGLTFPGPQHFCHPLRRPPFEPPGRIEIQVPLALLQDLIRRGLITSPLSNQNGPISLEQSMDQISSEAISQEQSRSEASNDSTGDNPADLSLHNHQRENRQNQSTDKYMTPTSHSTSRYASVKPFLMNDTLKLSPNRDGFSLGSHLKPGQNQHENSTKPLHHATLGNQDNTAPLPPDYMPLRKGVRGEESMPSTPPALMVNSSSPSMIQLTQEEYFKLKKLISSSP